jgi:hypothetical protein
VIAARLSKKRTDLCVTSPNQYALLESEISTSAFGCTVPTPVNKSIFPTKPNYARLAPWAKEHAQLHECFCKRESCYWHHPGNQFNEKEYEDQEVKPRVNEDQNYQTLEVKAGKGPRPLNKGVFDHLIVKRLKVWNEVTGRRVNRKTRHIGLRARRKKSSRIWKQGIVFKEDTRVNDDTLAVG